LVLFGSLRLGRVVGIEGAITLGDGPDHMHQLALGGDAREAMPFIKNVSCSPVRLVLWA